MKKSTFLKVFKVIEAQHKKELEFCEALDKMVDGRFVPQMSNDLESVLIQVLQEEFKDKNDWIGWWMYEKNFGRDKKMTANYKNGKKIKLDTAEDLWKFLNENKK